MIEVLETYKGVEILKEGTELFVRIKEKSNGQIERYSVYADPVMWKNNGDTRNLNWQKSCKDALKVIIDKNFTNKELSYAEIY